MKKSFKPSKALTALLLLTSVQAMDFTPETYKDTVSRVFQNAKIKPFQPKNIFKGEYEYRTEGVKPQDTLKNQKVTIVPVDSEVVEVRLEGKRDNSAKSLVTGLISQTNPSNETVNQQPLSESDGRQRVENVYKFPNSTNVFLEMIFGQNKKFRASGVMVGPYHVLTAGHNVYDNDKGEWASLVTAYPGTNEKVTYFGSSSVVKAFIPQKYHEGDDQDDLAVLILQEALGYYTGWTGLYAASNEVYSDKDLKFYVSGYPGDKESGQLWEMKGEIALPSDKVLKYKIPTAPGQSGSPVWRKTEASTVVGIHVRGEEGFNEGTRITVDRLDWILSCLAGPPSSSSPQKSLQETSTQPLKETPKTKDPEKKESPSTLSTLQHAPCPHSLLSKYVKEEQWNNQTLQEFRLSNIPIGDDGAAALAQNTSWTKLETLWLSNTQIGDAGAIALAQNKSWTKLETLALSHIPIGDAGAKALAQNTSWINLQTLVLSNNTKIGDEGAEALAQNTSWTQLLELNLYFTPIGDAGAKGLAQNTSWTQLQTLYLNDTPIGDAGAKGLAQNTSWTQLQTLYLNDTPIGDDGAAALAQNTSWTQLQTLVLHNTQIGDPGAEALAQNTSWTQLQTLWLSNTQIGDAGAIALAQNKSWTQLRWLYLHGTQIGDEGAKALAKNTSWTKLQELYLGDTQIGDEGAKALAQNTSWAKLQKLYLYNTKIGDWGAKALSQNTSWTKLQTLSLSKTQIGDLGAIALAQNTSWTQLLELYLNGTEIGDAGAKGLAQNTSWTQLLELNLSDTKITRNVIFADGFTPLKKRFGQYVVKYVRL